MPLILSIEDDKNIQELIRYNLMREGFRVLMAGNGNDGYRLAEKELPHLILLDLLLPGLGMNGLAVCRSLKTNNNTAHIPIIMLTAKSEESDIVIGLESGADDYLPKPFSPRVLIARIGSVLRRTAAKELRKEELITIHNISIDIKRYEVRQGSQKFLLSATEFAILEFFARNPGWVFSREQIIDAVRGNDYSVTMRSIDVQIFGLRKKLGDKAEIIETVRGIGYRLRAE